jgi:hypothetical protein
VLGGNAFMGEEVIFKRINDLLSEVSYTGKIKSLRELREFIVDDNNKRLDVYDEIEELHSLLIFGPGMW